MSKVESNDEQRIREMQAAQRKSEVQTGDAQQAKGRKEAFNQAMRNSHQRSAGARQTKAAQDQQTEAAKAALASLRKSSPKMQHEAMKRAALGKAFAFTESSQLRRVHEGTNDRQVMEQRASDAIDNAGTEESRVREVEHDEENREFERVEEKLEMIRDSEVRVEADDRRRGQGGQRQGEDSEREERRRPQAASAVQGPKGSGTAAPALPPESFKEIVSSVVSVLEDGRTRLQVQLQGRGLEGVKLEVRNEGGKVSCAFEGCSDRLRKQLRRAEERLKTALSKKGFKLVGFSAT